MIFFGSSWRYHKVVKVNNKIVQIKDTKRAYPTRRYHFIYPKNCSRFLLSVSDTCISEFTDESPDWRRLVWRDVIVPVAMNVVRWGELTCIVWSFVRAVVRFVTAVPRATRRMIRLGAINCKETVSIFDSQHLWKQFNTYGWCSECHSEYILKRGIHCK